MDDQFKICRLCFKLITKKDYKSMEDELVIVTAIFLDLVNWRYSENPLLCYECVENLQKSYDFKSTCLASEEQIYTASGCKQDDVDLWQIRNENESEEFREHKKICRFCLNLNEKDTCFQLGEKEDMHLMLQKCLPELDLLMVREPVICLNCFDALKSLFNFIVSCLSVEERINIYRDTEGSDSKDKVNLYNVLQFTNIKKKSDVDDAYVEEFVIEKESEKVIKFENSEDEEFEAKPEVFLKTEPMKFEEESGTSMKIEHVEDQAETEESTRFYHSSHLREHIRHHTGEEPFQCVVLNKRFTLESEKPYACRLCDQRCLNEANLKVHMRTHTQEGPYLCTVCDKTFIRSSNLNVHMQKHTREKVGCNVCVICDKNFKTVAYLRKHTLIHTGQQSSPCTICNRHFTHRYLKIHMRTHTGEKPYTCNVCDQKFATSSNLWVHHRNHKKIWTWNAVA